MTYLWKQNVPAVHYNGNSNTEHCGQWEITFSGQTRHDARQNGLPGLSWKRVLNGYSSSCLMRPRH